MSSVREFGWERLRQGGLLLDTQRLDRIAEFIPEPLLVYIKDQLRRRVDALMDQNADVPEFVAFVLETICGFSSNLGTWRRGNRMGTHWTRRAVTGEAIKPRQLWQGTNGGLLPVFLDTEKRVGVGRGRKAAGQVLQWLRAGSERLAVITNSRQWRLVFAGLDFDAWCEWDVDLWFEEGELSPQVTALRTLLSPAAWIPTAEKEAAPLLQAVLDSRKGQADLSTDYGITGLRESLEKTAARGSGRLSRSWNAWPRILGLFRLVF